MIAGIGLMRQAELEREEWIEERSAILEYEAGFPRHIAERMAVEQWREYAAKRSGNSGERPAR